MDDFLFLTAKVFFVVSSLAVFFVVAGFVLLLLYLLPLVRDARYVVAKFRDAAQELEGDFEKLRAAAGEEGAKGKAIADSILGFVGNALHTPQKRRRTAVRKAVVKDTEER